SFEWMPRHRDDRSFPTRPSSDLRAHSSRGNTSISIPAPRPSPRLTRFRTPPRSSNRVTHPCAAVPIARWLRRLTPLLASRSWTRSEEHTSELPSLRHLGCRLLLD